MDKKTIYSRFHDKAVRHHDNPAIVTDYDNVTYAELDHRINAIVEKIGDVRHKYIGIVMSHGIDMIAAMLAVLKTGAAYIPAEPTLPVERIKYMMDNAGVRLVITDEYCKNLPLVTEDYPDLSTPDGLAYILYTS